MKKKRNKPRRKPQTYSEEFKWKVVKEVLSGELSQADAKRKYNIGSNSAILYWTREFSGSDNPRESRLLFMPENKMSKKDNLTSDQKRIKELEEALRKEKNKSFLYEKMMEVIEEDYGVSFRKKPGAEQLEKLEKKKVNK